MKRNFLSIAIIAILLPVITFYCVMMLEKMDFEVHGHVDYLIILFILNLATAYLFARNGTKQDFWINFFIFVIVTLLSSIPILFFLVIFTMSKVGG